MMKNTPEQEELFKWVDQGQGHGALISVAGSGKTTSIIQCLNYIDDETPVIVCSFTKLVAEELSKRVKAEKFTNVSSTTLNSLGWGLCKANVKGVKLEQYKTDNILQWVLSKGTLSRDDQADVFRTVKSVVKRVIGLLKSYVVREDVSKWIDEVIHLHDVELPEGDSVAARYSRTHFHKIVSAVYSESVNYLLEMDFDDQKFMPVYHGWTGKAPAFIIVDEYQDVNVCDIELVSSFVGPNTRTLWVGDPRQSIYGFRGSLPDACDRVIKRFNCHTMSLSVCWRCPDKVIALAKETVPQITGPNPNPRGEGIVETIETKEFKNSVRVGDYVISRTTAPLVKRCLELVQMGTPAMVKGKDVGRTLIQLIDKIAGRLEKVGVKKATHDVEYHKDFIRELSLYKSEEVMKLEAAGRDELAVSISDRCEALEVFALQANSIAATIAKIESLFADDIKEDDVVLFLTGHKCKGLQRKRVFFLRPDLCPHPKATSENAKIQESNLRYVIQTRAEAELYMVNKEKDEK